MGLANEGRHHLLLVYKQVHDKRGIAESLHVYCDLSLDFSVLSDSTRFTFPHRFMCSLSRHGMVHNSESRDTKLFNDVIHVQVQSSIHP